MSTVSERTGPLLDLRDVSVTYRTAEGPHPTGCGPSVVPGPAAIMGGQATTTHAGSTP